LTPLVAEALVATAEQGCCWKGLFRALATCRDATDDPEDELLSGQTPVAAASRFVVVAVVNETHAGVVDLNSGAWLPNNDNDKDAVLRCAVTRVSCGRDVDVLVPRSLSLRVICVDRLTWRAAQVVDDRDMARAELVAEAPPDRGDNAENDDTSDPAFKSFTRAGDLISYGRDNGNAAFLGFVNVRARGSHLRLVAAGLETYDDKCRVANHLDRLCNHLPATTSSKTTSSSRSLRRGMF